MDVGASFRGKWTLIFQRTLLIYTLNEEPTSSNRVERSVLAMEASEMSNKQRTAADEVATYAHGGTTIFNYCTEEEIFPCV